MSAKQAAIELSVRKYEEFRLESERRQDDIESARRTAAIETRRARVRERWERQQQQRSMLNGFMAHLSEAHQQQMMRMHELERADLAVELAVMQRARFTETLRGEQAQKECRDGISHFETTVHHNTATASSEQVSPPTDDVPPKRRSAFAPPPATRDPSVALTRALVSPAAEIDPGMTSTARRRRQRAASMGVTAPATRVSTDAFNGHHKALAASFGAGYDPSEGDAYLADL